MPRQAPIAERELSDDEALAALKGEKGSAASDEELSDDEALKQLAGAVPQKPGPLGSFAGPFMEVGADLAALPGIVGNYMSGTQPASSGGMRPIPGSNPAAPPTELAPQALSPDAGNNVLSAGLRGAAQQVYPQESRGRGTFLGEQVPSFVGQNALPLAAGMALGPVALAGAATAQIGVPLYHEVLDKTGDKDKAMLGLLAGAAVAPLDLMGAGGSAISLARKLRKIDDATGGAVEKFAISQLLTGGAKGAAQVGAQQGLLDVIQEKLTGEDLDNWGRMRDVLGPGAALGAVFKGMEGVAEHLTAETPPDEAATAQAVQEAPGAVQPPEALPAAQEPIAAPEAAQAAPAAPEAPPTYEQAAEHLLARAETPAAPEPLKTYAHTEEPAENFKLPPNEKVGPVKVLPIASLKSKQLERFRQGVDPERVDALVDAMGAGTPLPPVTAVYAPNGDLVVLDGHHRIEAAKAMGFEHVPVRIVGEESAAKAVEAPKAAPAQPRMRTADVLGAMRQLVTDFETGEGEDIPGSIQSAERVLMQRRDAGIPPTEVDDTLAELVKVGRLNEPLQIGSKQEAAQTAYTEGALAKAKAVIGAMESAREESQGRRAGEVQARPEVIEPKKPSGIVEMMAGPPSPFGKVRITAKKIKSALREFLVSPGHVPRGTRRNMELAHGAVNAEIEEISRRAVELHDAMKKAVGPKWRETHGAIVDSAFKGNEQALSQLPPEAGSALADMRGHLDRFQRLLVKRGGVIDPEKQPELARIVLESQGEYARRSYRAHLDPEWAEKVPADVRQRTFDLFRSWDEYAGMSDAEIHGELDAILQKAKETAGNPWAALAAGKLGRKDLSIFKHRKEIPKELRVFLGEIEDPIANYANSVVKLATVVAKHEAFTKIREEGLGGFLHEKPNGPYTARLSSETSPGLRPLDGLYTTPEIKRALTEVTPSDQNIAMKAMLRANSFIKWGKVLGQPWGIMRNLQGNIPLMIANGHLPSFFRAKEWKLALGKGELAEQKRLIRLGVIGEGSSTAEWQDLRASLKKTPEELAKPDPNVLAMAKGGVEKVFEAADNAPKARFFYAEEAALKKAGYSDAQAEALASDRTRDLMPTSARMAKGLKLFRRQPFLGSYFTFRAEVIRTMGNRLRLISEELRSENPAVRRMGARRAAGTLIATTMTPAAVYAANMLNGTDADEDRDKREFVPPWDKNSRMVWFGGESSGNYLDLSDVDPFTAFTDPLTRVMGGADANAAMEGFIKDEGDAYFGWSPSMQIVIDLARGADESGKPIDDSATYLKKAIQPGFVASIERGSEKGFGSEAAAAATGFRRYDFDAEKSFGFEVSRFAWQIRDTTEAMKRQEKAAPGKGASLKAFAEDERKNLFEELGRKAQAAIRLGVPPSKVRGMLDKRLSREVTNAILLGRYVAYKPSKKKKKR